MKNSEFAVMQKAIKLSEELRTLSRNQRDRVIPWIMDYLLNGEGEDQKEKLEKLSPDAPF